MLYHPFSSKFNVFCGFVVSLLLFFMDFNSVFVWKKVKLLIGFLIIFEIVPVLIIIKNSLWEEVRIARFGGMSMDKQYHIAI